MIVYGVSLGIWIVTVVLSYLIKSPNQVFPLDKGVLNYLYPAGRVFMDICLTKTKMYCNRKLEQALREVYVLEDIEDVKYQYFLEKTSKIIAVLGMVLLLGLTVSFTEHVQEGKAVTSLERPQPGMGESQYQLIVQEEGRQEKIDVAIGEREYTKEEKQEKIQEVFEKLEEIIIGKNQDLMNVTSNLNLETQVEDVTILWESEQEELIDVSGEVNLENIYEKGEEVNLKAILSFDGYEEEYLITVRVLPPKENNSYASLQKELEKQNSKTQQQVKLPKRWEGRDITFYPVIEKISLYIGGAGVLICLLLFLIKDKEIYKQVEQRENQMLLDYGEIISKLSLLYQAGMTITGAWEKIIREYEKNMLSCKIIKKRYAYEEMKITWQHIKDGRAVAKSMGEFGRRCRLNCYLKLGNLLEQNIHKGTKGLVGLLEAERVDAKEIRMDVIRKRGEEAGIKLIFPMVGMLGICIIVIIIPSFLSMKF